VGGKAKRKGWRVSNDSYRLQSKDARRSGERCFLGLRTCPLAVLHCTALHITLPQLLHNTVQYYRETVLVCLPGLPFVLLVQSSWTFKPSLRKTQRAGGKGERSPDFKPY